MSTNVPPKMSRRQFCNLIGIASCSAVLIACSGNSPSAQATASSTGPDPDEIGTATADPGASRTDAAGTVLLEIGTASGATDFTYDKATLEAPAGKKIKLKFSNNTDLKDEVGHNWVLVKPGQEDSVVANGQAAGDDKDWLNTDDPGIIAHSRLIEGGQSNTVRFTSPAAGEYTYLCTFPDHYAAGQKGTFTVK